MDPSRKRRVRLIVALTAAMLLAGALIYTSFSAATDAKQPSQLLRSANAGQSYQLTGKVVPGSVVRTVACCASPCATATAPAQLCPSHTRAKYPTPSAEG